MANPNPKPRPKIGTARYVKLTLPEPIWEQLDQDDISTKTAEKLRLILESYYGIKLVRNEE